MKLSNKILIAALTLGLSTSPMAFAKTSDTTKQTVEKVKASKKSAKSSTSKKKDLAKSKATKSKSVAKSKASKSKDAAKAKASISKAKAKAVASNKRVNINKANKQQLVSVLNGVGDKKAQAIIDYRKKNGVFKSSEDLLNVKGIGAKILAKNTAKIMLKGEAVVSTGDKKKKAKQKKSKSTAK